MQCNTSVKRELIMTESCTRIAGGGALITFSSARNFFIRATMLV
jgi:hypothetical protein